MNETTGETPQADVSFEQALELLESIVHDLEEGRIGLAESLARYEQGVALLRKCYTMLENAERRIELLSGSDAQGRPVTESLDDRAMSLEEKAQARGRRRTRSANARSPLKEDVQPEQNKMDEPGTLF